MTIQELGWIKYPLATFVVLAFVTVLGLPYAALVRKRLPNHCLLLGPHVGMALLVVGVSWYGFLGTRLPGWLLYVVALTALAIAVALVIERSSAPKLLDRAFARYALPWTIGVLIATIFMLPAISSSVLPPSYVTSFAVSNNDLGSYIAEAANMADAGFDSSGYWYGWNAGTSPSTMAAKTDHTGANALLASVSAVLHQPVWKIATISLMLVLSSILAGAVALARSFMESAESASLAIGIFASTTFLIWYLAANFFLAQLLSISLVLAQLALVQTARRTGLDWRVVFSVGALAAGSMLSSPEVGSVGIVFMVALIAARAAGSLLARMPVRSLLRSFWNDAALVIASALVAVLAILPFVADLISRTQRVGGFGIVGWSLDLRNAPASLIGLSDAIGSPRTPVSTLVATLVALGLVAALVWAYKRRDKDALIAGVFAFAMIVIGVAGSLRWGPVAYQSWKLIVTLSIPLAVAALVIALRPLNESWRLGVMFVVVALIGANVSIGARSWDTVRYDAAAMRGAAVPLELSEFLKSGPLQRQPAINIYVPSLWLTMAAPAVYERRAAMSSPSYLSGGRPGPHPYSCSLYDRTLYKPTKRQKVVANSTNYVLVATPSCK